MRASHFLSSAVGSMTAIIADADASGQHALKVSGLFDATTVPAWRVRAPAAGTIVSDRLDKLCDRFPTAHLLHTIPRRLAVHLARSRTTHTRRSIERGDVVIWPCSV